MITIFGLALIYACIQALAVRWVLMRKKPFLVRAIALVPTVAGLPWIVNRFLVDPAFFHESLPLMAAIVMGAVLGFVIGVLYHLAAPWLDYS